MKAKRLFVFCLVLAGCSQPEISQPQNQWKTLQDARHRPLAQALAVCEPRADIERRRAEVNQEALQAIESTGRSGGAGAAASFATGFLEQRTIQIAGRRAYDSSLRSCMATQGWIRN